MTRCGAGTPATGRVAHACPSPLGDAVHELDEQWKEVGYAQLGSR